MRLIGHFADEPSARVFADYLYVQGIENQLEHQKQDGWGIWILDEDKIDRASGLLTTFRRDPSDPKYRTEAKGAAELRAGEAKEKEAYGKKVRNRRHLFRSLTPYGFGPLTFALMVACIAVFFLSKFGADHQAIMSLFITDFDETFGHWDASLPEIRHGQIWRLFTPVLIHFGPWHIIFNMLCLRDLGSSPDCGGMSGVIYGLLGYVWIRGKLDPASGLYLHPTTVMMMLIWFVVCFVGLIPRIANTTHAAGLAIGMGWGFLSSLRYR